MRSMAYWHARSPDNFSAISIGHVTVLSCDWRREMFSRDHMVACHYSLTSDVFL